MTKTDVTGICTELKLEIGLPHTSCIAAWEKDDRFNSGWSFLLDHRFIRECSAKWWIEQCFKLSLTDKVNSLRRFLFSTFPTVACRGFSGQSDKMAIQTKTLWWRNAWTTLYRYYIVIGKIIIIISCQRDKKTDLCYLKYSNLAYGYNDSLESTRNALLPGIKHLKIMYIRFVQNFSDVLARNNCIN